MTDLTVQDYSEKSIVVRGDSKPYKEELKALGGKWNALLNGGAGWIFPKKLEDKVRAFVDSGKVAKTPPPKKVSTSTKATNPATAVNIPDREEFLEQAKLLFGSLTAEEKLTLLVSLGQIASTRTTAKVVAPPSKAPAPTKAIEAVEEDEAPAETVEEEEEPASPPKRVVKKEIKHIVSKKPEKEDDEESSDDEAKKPSVNPPKPQRKVFESIRPPADSDEEDDAPKRLMAKKK